VPKWRKGFEEILEDAGFSGALPAITTTDAAILFLAQNLRILSDGGTLGIIVPDSLVCAEKYYEFRKSLLNKYDILEAIQLPRRSFVGTDALAHILVISKQKPSTSLIKVSSLSSETGKCMTLDIERDQAIQRLDYGYHASQFRNAPDSTLLRDVAIDVKRGNFNSAEVRAELSFVLHTTNINNSMYGEWVDFEIHSSDSDFSRKNVTFAEPGDLIVARVGRNAAGKIIGVAEGRIALSDCLYRLRIKPEYRDHVLRCLSSEFGHHWIKSRAHGVAARHLSKIDLLNFPLDCYGPV
jgi:type I restriction enzyme M protein